MRWYKHHFRSGVMPKIFKWRSRGTFIGRSHTRQRGDGFYSCELKVKDDLLNVHKLMALSIRHTIVRVASNLAVVTSAVQSIPELYNKWMTAELLPVYVSVHSSRPRIGPRSHEYQMCARRSTDIGRSMKTRPQVIRWVVKDTRQVNKAIQSTSLATAVCFLRHGNRTRIGDGLLSTILGKDYHTT